MWKLRKFNEAIIDCITGHSTLGLPQVVLFLYKRTTVLKGGEEHCFTLRDLGHMTKCKEWTSLGS